MLLPMLVTFVLCFCGDVFAQQPNPLPTAVRNLLETFNPATSGVATPILSFTQTFTPIPSESVRLTETQSPTRAAYSSITAFRSISRVNGHYTTTAPIDAPVQTTVNFPLGDSYLDSPYIDQHGSKIAYIGSILGSIIGVDATATTYRLNCNPKAFSTRGNAERRYGCLATDALTITQGPSSMIYSTSVTALSFTAVLTVDCTNVPTALSCVSTIDVTSPVHRTTRGTLIPTSLPILPSTDHFVRTHTYDSAHLLPYVAVPITAGIEKISAFKTGATTTSSQNATSGPIPSNSITTGAAAAETSKPSGSGTLQGRVWVVLLVIACSVCYIT